MWWKVKYNEEKERKKKKANVNTLIHTVYERFSIYSGRLSALTQVNLTKSWHCVCVLLYFIVFPWQKFNLFWRASINKQSIARHYGLYDNIDLFCMSIDIKSLFAHMFFGCRRKTIRNYRRFVAPTGNEHYFRLFCCFSSAFSP